MKKLLVYLLVCVSLLMTGCSVSSIKNSSENPNNIKAQSLSSYDWGNMAWESITYQPETIDNNDTELIQVLNRRQQIFNRRSDNRLILDKIDITVSVGDDTKLTDSNAVKVNDINAVFYIYGDGNKIEYNDISDDLLSKINKPDNGESVLEWKTDYYLYRLIGSFSKEEMLKIAQSLLTV